MILDTISMAIQASTYLRVLQCNAQLIDNATSITMPTAMPNRFIRLILSENSIGKQSEVHNVSQKTEDAYVERDSHDRTYHIDAQTNEEEKDSKYEEKNCFQVTHKLQTISTKEVLYWKIFCPMH